MDSAPPEHPLLIMTQYIKDFSFENPNAPTIYYAIREKPPEITVNIDVAPTRLHERTYEIVLSLRVNAMSGENVAFLVELDYAAVVQTAESVTDEALEPLLLSETPRYLFPFARNILAEVTRDASFPPLIVNPIDFERYYQRNKKDTLSAALATQQGTAQASSEPEAAATD